MRKLISIGVSLFAGFTMYAGVLTYSTNLAAAAKCNVPNLNGGGVISYVLLSADTTNAGSCLVYDSPGNWITQTNSGYSYNTYGVVNTNGMYSPTTGTVVYTYTNYYGVTYNGTNYMGNELTVTSNYVAGSTNVLTPMLTLATATNTSTTFMGINRTFRSGICVTNTGSGTIGLTFGIIQ